MATSCENHCKEKRETFGADALEEQPKITQSHSVCKMYAAGDLDQLANLSLGEFPMNTRVARLRIFAFPATRNPVNVSGTDPAGTF